ncbi:chemotaxis protein CheW [Desulfovulcanus sp.]
MKTPEEYFQEQNFDSIETDNLHEFTAEEKQFLQKYLGQDVQKIVRELDGKVLSPESLDKPVVQERIQEKDQDIEEVSGPTDVAPDLEQRLKKSAVIQLVSFYMGEQEYALPVEIVSEVIRYVLPTKLPAAPDYLAGIVNLRGRITPVLKLNRLLDIFQETEENKFIVVCKYRGLQFGILVNTIATMYRIEQQDIDWEIETNLGVSGDFVAGLIKGKEKLIAILSIDRLVGVLIES